MINASQTAADLASNAVPRQRHGLRCHELDGEAIIYDFAHHALHYLNATAYQIWQGCDGATTVEGLTSKIVNTFADERDCSTPALMADTQQALQNLISNGLVDCVGI